MYNSEKTLQSHLQSDNSTSENLTPSYDYEGESETYTGLFKSSFTVDKNLLSSVRSGSVIKRKTYYPSNAERLRTMKK